MRTVLRWSLLSVMLFIALAAAVGSDSSDAQNIHENWDYSDGILHYFGQSVMPDYTEQYNPISELGAENATEIQYLSGAVTYIGAYTFYKCKISEVTIPSSVSSIGEYAFAQSAHSTEAGKTLRIEGELRTIGDYAFENQCFESVEIPVSVTSIGQCAFQGCEQLKTLKIDSTDSPSSGYLVINKYLFQDCISLASAEIGNTVLYIDDSAFKGTTELKSISFKGSSVTSINGNAFEGSGLTDLTIPDGVTYIGSSAFKACESLESVTFGQALNEIDTYAFDSCVKLKKVVITNGIKTIGECAFNKCSGLEELNIGSSASVGVKSFYECTSLSELKISEGVTVIGDYAFSGCRSLGVLSIPGTATEIGEGVFSNCTGLTDVTFASGIVDIPDSMFSGCIRLSVIEFPSTLKTIGDKSFTGCKSLTDLTIPNQVTSLGEGSFKDCTALYKLTVPVSLDTVCSNTSPAFENCSNVTYLTMMPGITIGFDYGQTIEENSCYLYTPWHISLESVKEITFDKSILSIGKNTFVGFTFCDKNGKNIGYTDVIGQRMVGTYELMQPYVEPTKTDDDFLSDSVLNAIYAVIIIFAILLALLVIWKLIKIITVS